MEILDTLKQAGLNEKQAAVYMALLELGTATVHPISNKAQVKRPTTYLILEELQARGLVSVVPRVKKVLYTAENPEKIVFELGRKQELVKRFMPQLLALYNAKVDKPQVLLFEGKEAVREVYERILHAKEVAWFSTIKDVISIFPDFPKRLNEQAMAGKVKVRELLTKSKFDLEYVKTMKHGENFVQHFATEEAEFLTDNCLYDGNVVFFSFQPYISAIQIRSQGIYKSLKNLYEFAWNASEPYEKVMTK
jgi:HTH-type transcriptional regulator, sugar sensing transcriptional regulator